MTVPAGCGVTAVACSSGSDRKIWRPDDSTGSCLCWNADNDAVMTKDMNLRDSGIVLSWLSGLLAAFMSSLAGLWGKTGLAALFGEDVLLPNLTECFFTMSHGFWLVPICMGILLITTRKQKAIQDTVVLASWSISVLWLAYVIAAFLLPVMGLDWRMRI